MTIIPPQLRLSQIPTKKDVGSAKTSTTKTSAAKYEEKTPVQAYLENILKTKGEGALLPQEEVGISAAVAVILRAIEH